TRPTAAPPETTKADALPQTTAEVIATGPAPRGRLGWRFLGGLIALTGAVLLGHLGGLCTGRVAGFAVGVIAGDVPGTTTAGASLGAAIGRVALPALLLVGWVLVRCGQRHYEATAPWRRGATPTPPPALIRRGPFLVF